VEAYNVFNHTNWSTLNGAAQFNAAGGLVNAADPTKNVTGTGVANGFGALTAVRAAGATGSPRIIQLAGKINF
jgi:hypothetical protein